MDVLNLSQREVRQIQLSQWKRQLLDGASELFSSGETSKDNEEGQSKAAELYQRIGRLQLELEWLQNSLCCSDAHERRKVVDHDHPKLSVSRRVEFSSGRGLPTRVQRWLGG